MSEYAGLRGLSGVFLPPLSPAELQMQMVAMRAEMQQAGPPSIEQLLAMTNYRRPVHIPQGWVDWYAIGDQLH